MRRMLPELSLSGFVTALASQAAGFLVTAGALFLLFWRLLRRPLAGRRIQPRERFDRRQFGHELRHSASTMLVGTGIATGIAALHAAGLVQLPVGFEGWSTTGAIALTIGILLLGDAWFYACHRLLHTPWLYRHVHAVHHRSVDVNPFSTYSFHAVEAFVLGAWIVPVLLLVPVPLPLLGALQAIGLANNLVSHLGYELLPRRWVRWPLLRWTNTATFHNLHHTSLRGNYGLMFRCWDRLCGTEVPDYEQRFGSPRA